MLNRIKKSQAMRYIVILAVLAAMLLYATVTAAKSEIGGNFKAADIVAGIKAGVHLDYGLSGGNYFSGYYEFGGNGAEKVERLRYGIIEEQWNIRPVWADRNIIETYKREGFNAVRFPVAFSPYMKNDTHKMDAAILDALEEYVTMILENDMYAIFCPAEYFGTAFDGEGLNDDWMRDEFSEYIDARFAALWRQVAERFKDYGERVIFEANNEPHFNFDLYWEDEGFGGLDKIIDIMAKRINEMNRVFVDAVRQTGGNNERRLLLLNETPWALNRLALPDDDYIGVAPHYYACAFWDSWSRDDERAKQEVDVIFDSWEDFIERTGVPILITEGAIMEGMPHRDRLDLAEYSVDRLMEIGIPWVWFGEFDDAWLDPPEYRAALYDWREKRWVWPDLRDILLKPAKQTPKPSPTPTPSPISSPTPSPTATPSLLPSPTPTPTPSPLIAITKIIPGSKQADINFAIKSPNGNGYTVYISTIGINGLFTKYADVSYNANGAKLKGLTNGKQYFVYIEYNDGKGNTSMSKVVDFIPGK